MFFIQQCLKYSQETKHLTLIPLILCQMSLKRRKTNRLTQPSSRLSKHLFYRKPEDSTHPQLSVFGTEGKWRIFRKSRNIFGRTSFSIIIVSQKRKNKSKLQCVLEVAVQCYRALRDLHFTGLFGFSLSASALKLIYVYFETNLYLVKAEKHCSMMLTSHRLRNVLVVSLEQTVPVGGVQVCESTCR